MTRRLILIRHTKSGWDDLYADDHARTLTDRGQKAAEALGVWLAAQGYIPDLILTSDAMRTLQTTTLIKRGMGTSPQTKEVAALYHAAPQTIIDCAKATAVPTLAIIGHNPGIAMAAELLVTAPPAHRRFADYPTGATTVLDFEDTAFCQSGRGAASDFTVPKDL